MMDCYEFEVFGGSSSYPRLRWFPTVGPMVDRGLDRAGIDVFVVEVDARYKMLAPDLRVLGGDLFRWLDGPTERWLAGALERARPMVVYLDCDEKLRGLPWELMYHDGFVAVDASHPVLPVRRASLREPDLVVPGNRPLRVLFMASSPEDVVPVLDFEYEESVILQAAAAGLVEIVVEESGTLAGLKVLLERFGAGYFDVLHITGHAMANSSGPRFVLENDFGGRADASATDIAAAVGPYWPALVFLSGCQTATASGSGEVASMAESLVLAGAPAVLGWALPVGDHAASALAEVLYRSLAVGAGRDRAVADARRALYTSNSPFWHLLRLYTDRTALGPLVTPPGEKGRTKLGVRPTNEQFLDPDGQVKVVSGDGFVGRRRQLQACLRTIRPGSVTGSQVLILHGMGGLGKSTLAARLLDRLRATNPFQAVWVGPIDDKEINKLTERITLDAAKHVEINKLLDRADLTFEAKMRFVFNGPLNDVACVFVFDDFENGNLEPDGNGSHVCTPAAMSVLVGFAAAIAATGNESRVIVTSRYDFALPNVVKARRESLVPLAGADLDKKLRLTANLGVGSDLSSEVRDHAIRAAAGIPRLIERLDRLISDPGTDIARVLPAIDTEEVEYREELLAEKLLAMQRPETRRLLALAAIYQIPVPVEALAVLSPAGPIQSSLDRAVAVGLIDTTTHLVNGARYLVSNLLKPLLENIDERLTDEDRLAAIQAGCRCLYDLWVNT